MQILVIWTGSDFNIIPDPARVRLGESVQWVFTNKAGRADEVLQWRISFRNASPFNKKTFRVNGITGPGFKQEIDAGPAENDGDFKYDVSVSSVERKLVIGEVDPMLEVRGD